MAGAERKRGTLQKQTRDRLDKQTRRFHFSRGGFQEEEGILEIDEINEEEADFEDFSDCEDDEYTDHAPQPLGIGGGIIRPLWVYAGGSFLWCNPKFGFHLRFREGVRKMAESFLSGFSSLGTPFQNPSPFFLFGFFREEWIRYWFMLSRSVEEEDLGDGERKGRGKKSFASRLRHFGKIGVIVPGTGLLPLSVFLAGKGQGTNSLPESIERPWIRYTFSEKGIGAKFKWKDVSEWLPEEYGKFIHSFNSLLVELLPGISGASLPVVPEASTLQRKKLTVFRKYLSEVDVP